MYLVSGITGQLGSEATRYLLNNGENVLGISRRSSSSNYSRLSDIVNHPNLTILTGDVTDANFINKTFSKYKPDFCLWYAAQSHVNVSFEEPSHTWDVTANAVLHVLEAIKNFSPNTKFVQASSSEMFSSNYSEDQNGKYQDENTRMSGNSPYAIAKLAAYNLVQLYRKSYNLFTSNIIMFNCEGKFRSDTFVTRKITKYIGNLIRNDFKYPKLKLGNIESFRDWGESSDYVRAYVMAANHCEPDDFVICTSETHSIREFLDEAFSVANINNWSKFVEIDESLKRPSEVPYLCGRYNKIKRILSWEPRIKFKELVKIMVEYDIKNA